MDGPIIPTDRGRIVNIVHPVEAALEIVIGRRDARKYKNHCSQMDYDYFQSLEYIRFLVSNGISFPSNDNKLRKSRRAK